MKISCATYALWAVATFLPPALLPQSPPSPDRWAKSSPAAALADPDFYQLSIDDRTTVLRRIDPKFAKMNQIKQDDYVWKTETANLPKPPTPKQVFTWDSNRPASTMGESVQAVEGEGIRVEASLQRDEFYRAHLRIVNRTKTPLKLCPRVFVLNVVEPKPQALAFEYPSRVAHEIVRAAENRRMRHEMQRSPSELGAKEGKATVAQNRVPTNGPGVSDLRSASDRATDILKDHLVEGAVDPGATSVGDVWFQRARGAKTFLLRVYVGEFAFDIPLALKR